MMRFDHTEALEPLQENWSKNRGGVISVRRDFTMKNKTKTNPQLSSKQLRALEIIKNVEDPNVGDLIRRFAGLPHLIVGRPKWEVVYQYAKFSFEYMTRDGSSEEREERTQDKGNKNDTRLDQDAGTSDGGEKPETNMVVPSQDLESDEGARPSPEEDGMEVKWAEKKVPICRYWKKGQCKKKSECRFPHPRICGKFMREGLSKYVRNGRGCDASCGLVHPSNICRDALKSGKCGRQQCRYRHFQNTKFLPQESQRSGRLGEIDHFAPGHHSSHVSHTQHQGGPSIRSGKTWADVTAPNRVRSDVGWSGGECERRPVVKEQPFLDENRLRLLIREVVTEMRSTGRGPLPPI